jgi:hypothetical protein
MHTLFGWAESTSADSAIMKSPRSSCTMGKSGSRSPALHFHRSGNGGRPDKIIARSRERYALPRRVVEERRRNGRGHLTSHERETG